MKIHLFAFLFNLKNIYLVIQYHCNVVNEHVHIDHSNFLNDIEIQYIKY
jgi:hypothetical protein